MSITVWPGTVFITTLAFDYHSLSTIPLGTVLLFLCCVHKGREMTLGLSYWEVEEIRTLLYYATWKNLIYLRVLS